MGKGRFSIVLLKHNYYFLQCKETLDSTRFNHNEEVENLKGLTDSTLELIKKVKKRKKLD